MRDKILSVAEHDFKCADCKKDIKKGDRYLSWKRRLCVPCTRFACFSKVSYYRAMVSELKIWERIENETREIK